MKRHEACSCTTIERYRPDSRRGFLFCFVFQSGRGVIYYSLFPPVSENLQVGVTGAVSGFKPYKRQIKTV